MTKNINHKLNVFVSNKFHPKNQKSSRDRFQVSSYRGAGEHRDFLEETIFLSDLNLPTTLVSLHQYIDSFY